MFGTNQVQAFHRNKTFLCNVLHQIAGYWYYSLTKRSKRNDLVSKLKGWVWFFNPKTNDKIQVNMIIRYNNSSPPFKRMFLWSCTCSSRQIARLCLEVLCVQDNQSRHYMYIICVGNPLLALRIALRVTSLFTCLASSWLTDESCAWERECVLLIVKLRESGSVQKRLLTLIDRDCYKIVK